MRSRGDVGRKSQFNAVPSPNPGYGTLRQSMETRHFAAAAHKVGWWIATLDADPPVPKLQNKSHPRPENKKHTEKNRCERQTKRGQEHDHPRQPRFAYA